MTDQEDRAGEQGADSTIQDMLTFEPPAVGLRHVFGTSGQGGKLHTQRALLACGVDVEEIDVKHEWTSTMLVEVWGGYVHGEIVVWCYGGQRITGQVVGVAQRVDARRCKVSVAWDKDTITKDSTGEYAKGIHAGDMVLWRHDGMTHEHGTTWRAGVAETWDGERELWMVRDDQGFIVTVSPERGYIQRCPAEMDESVVVDLTGVMHGVDFAAPQAEELAHQLKAAQALLRGVSAARGKAEQGMERGYAEAQSERERADELAHQLKALREEHDALKRDRDFVESAMREASRRADHNERNLKVVLEREEELRTTLRKTRADLDATTGELTALRTRHDQEVRAHERTKDELYAGQRREREVAERADVWQAATADALAQIKALREAHTHTELDLSSMRDQLDRAMKDHWRATQTTRALELAAGVAAPDATVSIPIVSHRGERRVMRLLAASCRVHHAASAHHPGDGAKLTGWDVDRMELRTIEIGQRRESDEVACEPGEVVG